MIGSQPMDTDGPPLPAQEKYIVQSHFLEGRGEEVEDMFVC